MKTKGTLFILSGPSGVGKGAMRELAVSSLDNMAFSVSCTTRAPRQGEVNHVHYHFLSVDEFRKKLGENKFLEHARVHDDMYGTLREDVECELDAGNDMILEIDVQGAAQIKKIMDCVSVFVMPPSREALAERLMGRKSESEERMRTRLRNADEEMKHAGDYDRIIVNDDLARAAVELKNIITENRRNRK